MSVRSRAMDIGIEVAPDWLLQPAIARAGRQLARRRFGPGFAEELARTQADSVRPPHEIAADQKRRVREIVGVAAARSPYYREVLGQDALQADDVPFSVWMTSLPLLERETVAQRGEDLLTRSPGEGDVLHHTSGSTGRRLSFWLPGDLRFTLNAAHMYAYYSWFGFSRGDRRATLGGRYLGRRASGRVLHNSAENQLVLGSHSLSSGSIARYAQALREFQPKALQGHPTVIERLIDLAGQCSVELPEIDSVFTTGETLDDHARECIQNALGARHIASMYGSGEHVVVASECDEGGGFHVDESFGYVELVPHPSGMKEVVATSLMNDLMPFIRYRTGDLVRGWIEEPCPCGRTWRRLDKVVGRLDDVVHLPNGRTVLPVEIRTFVTQRVPDTPDYTVRVRPAEMRFTVVAFDEDVAGQAAGEKIASALRELLGSGVQVDVAVAMPDEALSAGGKRRIVEVVWEGTREPR